MFLKCSYNAFEAESIFIQLNCKKQPENTAYLSHVIKLYTNDSLTKAQHPFIVNTYLLYRAGLRNIHHTFDINTVNLAQNKKGINLKWTEHMQSFRKQGKTISSLTHLSSAGRKELLC